MLMISSLFPFNKNEVNPFPTLTGHFALAFLSNLFNTDEIALVASLGRLYLDKAATRSYNTFFRKFSNVLSGNPPDWIILSTWTLLSFVSVDILLMDGFLIFLFCFVVRNNSWGNYSSWEFFWIIFNVVLVLFFAADFNLFSCAFVSLNLAFS